MIIFAGPSLAGCDEALFQGLDVRPPVEQGDVYLAAREGPTAIGIIDGYFEGTPSVWHKEILWALGQGIAVFGAASMGALRASELDAFGMIGVGRTYEAYASGEIEDDDEVALLHGPAEVGYPSLSLAMINARCTVQAAVAQDIISTKEAKDLITTAKSQFYKSRSWDSIFDCVDPKTLSPKRCSELRVWFRANEIDQKREDAIALVETMKAGAFNAPEPNFHFEQTDLWLTATKLWRRRDAAKESGNEEKYRLFADRPPFGD